ncbi:glycosyltransferase family 2 protein [Paenibacillus sp. GCM10023248]|uniref:glycosyltransferase family 2 protein n=1 Tax=Bacillales TaxID=1385 RepID=UPI002377F13D|nr:MULTISPECIES: glycosyltransferase family 2 protein [Bacillales]MDD9269959.1 glycosyltransferase family 2 protein [Paenibacillus sp. MAHUQ-63]MDR6883179.1 GT2 family glycosyltransferase [Bacillus sp. 3255]
MNATSIIIPTFNEKALLMDCIYSIRLHTQVPYEIIVVDNGSTDGTLEFLVQEGVPFVSFPDNRGFPVACNTGMKLAKGSTILLLNNDVLLTPNWLVNLLDCLLHRPDVGIVGPMTNYASGRQKIEEPYTTLEEMTLRYNEQKKGTYTEVQRLIGFCFLFKREVMDTIGLLDERFSPGHFEDDDYCYRARLAGYKLMMAEDTFIFHHGSASFGKKSQQQFKAIVKRSKDLFMEKWGVDPQQFI